MGRPTTEPPAAGPPATLTDDELQDVAAGADWEVFDPYHRWRYPRWGDDWLGWGDSSRPF